MTKISKKWKYMYRYPETCILSGSITWASRSKRFLGLLPRSYTTVRATVWIAAMDELFSFSTDRQQDIHHLRQICISSDDEEEDSLRETKKRSRSRPADIYDLDKKAGGVVDKRRRPWHEPRKNKCGRRFLEDDSEEEGCHSDSSSFSR